MSLRAPNRHHKRMNPIALLTNIQLCPYNTHIRCLGRPSNPKFHRIPTRRMNHYLPCRMIIMSLSKQSLHVRSMHQLSQGKTAEILKGTSMIIKFLMLLAAQSFDGLEVERIVNSDFGCKIEVIKGETITKKCKFIGVHPCILLNIQHITQPLHFLRRLLPLVAAISLSEMVMLKPIRMCPDDLKRLQPLLIVTAIHNFIELELMNGGATPTPRKLILRNNLCLQQQQSVHLFQF